MNFCGDVGGGSLYVAFDGVLPLLVWGGAFVSALVFLVEKVGFVGPEGGVIVAT
jgi:hypothetical protein